MLLTKALLILLLIGFLRACKCQRHEAHGREIREFISSTYHVASSIVLPAHLFPCPQIILQQVANLWDAVGVAETVAVLMRHRVAVPTGAAAVTIVMWHSYSSSVALSVMVRHKKAIAMVTQATLQRGAIFLVVSGDIVCSSAGLNFIVQLESSDINDYKTTLKSNLDFWQAHNTITYMHLFQFASL